MNERITKTYNGRKNLTIGARYTFSHEGATRSGRVCDIAYGPDFTKVTFKNICTY